MIRLPGVVIGGVRINKTTKAEVLGLIDQALSNGTQLKIATVNPEFVIEAQRDAAFKQALLDCDITVADGVGILWAASVQQYQPVLPGLLAKLEKGLVGVALLPIVVVNKGWRYKGLPEKISGSDFSLDIAKYLSKTTFSLFLLGERPGVAEEAAQRLIANYPGLQVSGVFSGDGSMAGDEETVVRVKAAGAEVVLVAYGAPKQELWIDRNLKTSGARVAMGVGGTFLFLAGQVKRAPVWWQQMGLEWLYRLVTQPWRWKRQLRLLAFIGLVLRLEMAGATSSKRG